MADGKMMEEYVNRVLEHLGKKDLSKVEEALGAKLQETKDLATKQKFNIDKMRETLRQAQARLQELTAEYSDTLSKAAGITESLLVLKFGDELKKEKEEREKEGAPPKGNGSQDPSAPPKKKRSKRTRSRATAR